MKIVYLMPSYSPGFGYIGNCLPKEFIKEGHETHIVTSRGKYHFNYPELYKSFQGILGDPIESEGSYKEGEIWIHRLPHRFLPQKTIYLKGLYNKLEEIKPDIVYCTDIAQPYNLQ